MATITILAITIAVTANVIISHAFNQAVNHETKVYPAYRNKNPVPHSSEQPIHLESHVTVEETTSYPSTNGIYHRPSHRRRNSTRRRVPTPKPPVPILDQVPSEHPVNSGGSQRPNLTPYPTYPSYSQNLPMPPQYPNYYQPPHQQPFNCYCPGLVTNPGYPYGPTPYSYPTNPSSVQSPAPYAEVLNFRTIPPQFPNFPSFSQETGWTQQSGSFNTRFRNQQPLGSIEQRSALSSVNVTRKPTSTTAAPGYGFQWMDVSKNRTEEGSSTHFSSKETW